MVGLAVRFSVLSVPHRVSTLDVACAPEAGRMQRIEGRGKTVIDDALWHNGSMTPLSRNERMSP
jgi:hypothetical protein